MQESAGDVILVIVVLGGIVAGIGGLVWLFIRYYDRNAAPAVPPEDMISASSREVEVGLEPDAALNAAVEMMLRKGYRLEGRTEDTATFARYKGSQVACLGCALMLLFIIPGLLYLIFAQKTVRISMAVHPIEGGSRIVIGGSQEGIVVATEWARELPKPGEAPVSDSSPSKQETPPTDATNIPEQIRRLAELRDAGLITSEEFEIKKAELLRRM